MSEEWDIIPIGLDIWCGSSFRFLPLYIVGVRHGEWVSLSQITGDGDDVTEGLKSLDSDGSFLHSPNADIDGNSNLSHKPLLRISPWTIESAEGIRWIINISRQLTYPYRLPCLAGVSRECNQRIFRRGWLR